MVGRIYYLCVSDQKEFRRGEKEKLFIFKRNWLLILFILNIYLSCSVSHVVSVKNIKYFIIYLYYIEELQKKKDCVILSGFKWTFFGTVFYIFILKYTYTCKMIKFNRISL